MKPHLAIVPDPPSESSPSTGTSPAEARTAVDADTLEAAFRRYAPYVARTALRLLGRYTEVEDVVQDVFVEAARGLHRLREPEAMKGWLSAVTVRVATHKLRMRRLKRWASLDEASDYMLEAPGATSEQRALLARVYTILDALSVNSRVAWTLRYIDNEPLETIAARCGCSVATVKRRIADAQRQVEEALSW